MTDRAHPSPAPADQAPKVDPTVVESSHLRTCTKCGATAVAFICSERGCPENGGGAYPWSPGPPADRDPAPPSAAVEALHGLYRVDQCHITGHWMVVRDYGCINGLSASFCIASADPAGDEADMGWSNGAVGRAEDRIRQIAAAMNAADAGRFLTPRIQFRIDAALERGVENIAIGVPLAREVVDALAQTAKPKGSALQVADPARPAARGGAVTPEAHDHYGEVTADAVAEVQSRADAKGHGGYRVIDDGSGKIAAAWAIHAAQIDDDDPAVEMLSRVLCTAEGLDPDFDYDPNSVASAPGTDIEWRLKVPVAKIALAALRSDPSPPVAAPAAGVEGIMELIRSYDRAATRRAADDALGSYWRHEANDAAEKAALDALLSFIAAKDARIAALEAAGRGGVPAEAALDELRALREILALAGDRSWLDGDRQISAILALAANAVIAAEARARAASGRRAADGEGA